jgi:hypothetical protein
MDSSTLSKEVEGRLFDGDQVDPSTLYGSEGDKMLLAVLPELHREQIWMKPPWHVDQVMEGILLFTMG